MPASTDPPPQRTRYHRVETAEALSLRESGEILGDLHRNR